MKIFLIITNSNWLGVFTSFELDSSIELDSSSFCLSDEGTDVVPVLIVIEVGNFPFGNFLDAFCKISFIADLTFSSSILDSFSLVSSSKEIVLTEQLLFTDLKKKKINKINS